MPLETSAPADSMLMDLCLEATSLLRVLLLIGAIARQRLAFAGWAPFDVATKDVELTFNDSAVMAWLAVCAPVVVLLAIAEPWILETANTDDWMKLRRLNLLRPAFDYSRSVIDDEFLGHAM
jgi:hypothetical protein